MIIHECIQGTALWLSLRAGIPTASEFGRILTPTGKVSTQAEGYMLALLAERLMGQPLTEHVSFYMERGSQMEASAVDFYELQKDCDTTPVGLITNDAKTVGASPDRLVGEPGLLEIKCPAAHTHMGYLLRKPVDKAYWPQVQGQLWVTGREWTDVLSYFPGLPPALVRVERDEDYIAKLAAAVNAFSVALEAQFAALVEQGYAERAEDVILESAISR